MDVIKSRQQKRQGQIQDIINSVRNSIYEEQEITYEKVVLATMGNLGLSRRTAKEYVDVALFQSGIKIENGEGRDKKLVQGVLWIV